MKKTIESKYPPLDKNVLWLDASGDVKYLKCYINGDWQIVGDDSDNNEKILEKVETKVDKVAGKQLSTQDYTTAEKNKLAGIADGATKVIVDSDIKRNSINPVQNAAVYNKMVDINTELYSYGIQWKMGAVDAVATRVGNMNYHATLPIQNGMRGAVVKFSNSAPEVKYYLDPEDWRFIADDDLNYDKDSSNIIYAKFINRSGVYTINCSNFSTDANRYLNRWLFIGAKTDRNYWKITAVDTSTKTATIVPENSSVEIPTSNASYHCYLGAVLNGFDGEVMVEVPEFWIRSYIDTVNKTREVRIATRDIDGMNWDHQDKTYVSAYRNTILSSVPTDMGYLSTLSEGSAVSIVNTSTYCRGGDNSDSYDSYLDTDAFRSNLGKPRWNLSRTEWRTAVRKSYKEIMNYAQYKRIFYWLYVIEYANFNALESFRENKTPAGYSQGGMGASITGMYLPYYNNDNPIMPIGYTNEFGNGTGRKAITITYPTTSTGTTTTTVTKYATRWHGIENIIGDLNNLLDGINIAVDGTGNIYKYYLWQTEDPRSYNDDYISPSSCIQIFKDNTSNPPSGIPEDWDTQLTAELYPTKYAEKEYSGTYRASFIRTGDLMSITKAATLLFGLSQDNNEGNLGPCYLINLSDIGTVTYHRAGVHSVYVC